MSDTDNPAAPAAKAPGKWFRTKELMSAVVIGLPLTTGIQYLTGLHASTTHDRIQGGISWLFVSAVTGLTVYALYRIRVNMKFNRRPFTPKDRAFCRWAALFALFGAFLLVLGSILWGPHGTHDIDVIDVITAQTLCCLLVSGVLYLLADVHEKGAELYEELEKGV